MSVWGWLRPWLVLPDLPHIDPARYVRETHGSDWIEHLDGVEWFLCDPPPRWHRCWAQTRFYDSRHGGTGLSERCACGGHRFVDLKVWGERNTRTAPTAEDRRRHALGKQFDAAADEFDAAERAGNRDGMRAARERVARAYAALYGEEP